MGIPDDYSRAPLAKHGGGAAATLGGVSPGLVLEIVVLPDGTAISTYG